MHSKTDWRTIETRDDLFVFLCSLAESESHALENLSAQMYLEAVVRVVNDLRGRFRNRGEAVPEQPSWRLIGEILDAAIVYD